MDLDQIENKKRRLLEAHKQAKVNETTLWARGDITEDEYYALSDSRLREIAALEIGGEEFTKAVELEKTRQSNKERRLRWHRFTEHAMRTFPYYADLDLTKSEKAVLVALMMAAAGKTRIEVANEWLLKKAGVSLASVRRAIKRLVTAGLMSKTERRIKGKPMNLWNVYHLKCSNLIAWASSHYFIQGIKSESHPPKGDYFEATENHSSEISNQETNKGINCRQKAKRSISARSTEGISSDDFVLLATGALRELGQDPSDTPTEDEILEITDRLRERRQPNFKPYIWQNWGIAKHGRRKSALAFLHTQMVKAMRNMPIPDERPWNEREPVRDADRYLASILKTNPIECRPDISIAAVLLSKQVYEIPNSLTRLVRARNKSRKDLKRSDHSGLLGIAA